MKYLFFLGFVLFSSFVAKAQEDDHREKIKALKTAYITEGLSLSPEEAQKFWPIYNEYIRKRRELYRKEHSDIGDLQCISEEGAKEMLREYVKMEKEDYLLKKNFFEDLQQIFDAKRIIKLKKVEDEFNHKMIKEYRERHSKN